MQTHKQLTPFQQALVDSILSEYSSLPAEEDLQHEFSPQFQKWAQKMIHKTRNPAWYYVNTTFKKVLIAAVILCILAATAMAIPAVREKIIDFFFTEHEERYGITFDPEAAATAPRQIGSVYTPTFVPDGYDLVDQNVTEFSVYSLWLSADSQLIYYTQDIIPENATNDSWIGIDAENAKRTSQIIGEYLVEIVWLEESYSLHWTDNAYIYSLELPNSISQETMAEIFNSIQPGES